MLTDNKQIGKIPSKEGYSTFHPIEGTITNRHFNTPREFASIMQNLSVHQCLTVGIYPDGYRYVPSSKVTELTKEKTITRQASNASPGHILCIDCDHEEFSELRGEKLHSFLEKYLPEFFSGAGYVTTSSTSSYLKDNNKFHQYYFFKTPGDLTQLIYLLDKLFKEHNMVTTTVASNYSRLYVKTPIDTKLRELQQPIFEMSEARLNLLNVDKPLNIHVQDGSFIEANQLTLPNLSLMNVDLNEANAILKGEEKWEAEIASFCENHNISTRHIQNIKRGVLPAETSLVTTQAGSHKISDDSFTSIYDEVINLITNKTPPRELYKAINEPEYASHQTAKLFYDDPYKLKTYRIFDQAHGGSNYKIIFNFDQLYDLMTKGVDAKLNPRQLLGIITAYSDMDEEEKALLITKFTKPCGVIRGDLARFLNISINDELPNNNEIDPHAAIEDISTLKAAIELKKIKVPKYVQNLLDQNIDLDRVFNTKHVSLLKDLILKYGADLVVKPGPKNQFMIASKKEIVGNLAQKYPLTNISEAANVATLDMLIDSITATKHIESTTFKASLFTEKLHFEGNRMEVTYKQMPPNFNNIPEVHRTILDQISHAQLKEFEEIYMKHSLGDIWDPLAELVYIKKIYPELKKDFLWVHMASDVGKSYNFRAAEAMVGAVETNLQQLLEQAAKVNPKDIAQAGFLFHDEVKHFNHSWNQLGAMYSIKPMHKSAALTQLPLKVLASAEKTLSKLTKQQANRLLTYVSDAESFMDLIEPKHRAAFGAVTHKVIYDNFNKHYGLYTSMTEDKAVRKAIIRGDVLAARLTNSESEVTEDVVKNLIVNYFIDEFGQEKGEVPLYPDNNSLHRMLKRVVVKNGLLIINFKKTLTLPKLAEYVFKQTSSSIETKAMSYETLNLEWEALGVENFAKQQSKWGVSGWYGKVLKIDLTEQGE